MERRGGSVWFVRFLRGTNLKKLIDLIGLSAFGGLGIAYSGHKGRVKAGMNTRTPVGLHTAYTRSHGDSI